MLPLRLVGLVAVCATAATSRRLASASASAERKVYAWASGSEAAAAQLVNASWEGIFDGVQANCGAKFVVNGSMVQVEVNETILATCAPLRKALNYTGAEFHVWINGVPEEAISNPAPVIASAIAAAKKYGFAGFSIDDETDCAPRSTLNNFTRWVGFIDKLADALHAQTPRIELSAAVQAMFGIEDVVYKPRCQPPENPTCSQACYQLPWKYQQISDQKKVGELMSNSGMDRWLEMDTYYFGTGRYLDALDWYTGNVAIDKLGVAVMNRKDISEEGYLARFHALHRSGANWLNLFILPASDAWLPYLRRWKSGCKHCPNAGALSCYETDAPC